MDGTLVTSEKLLTDATVAAVHQLRQARVRFAVTSGRPPRGMQMLVEPLKLNMPIAAFNGGMLVDASMQILEQHVLPEHLVPSITDLVRAHGLDVWLYRGEHWYVPDPKGPHVEREAWTVKFAPTVMHGLDGLTDGVVKVVGVSDDHHAVSAAAQAAHDTFGEHVTAAASQPYYLDITHPQANKGSVARYLARTEGLDSEEVATIGDMPNDVLMFAHSGLSIAMGNADPQVKRAARRVTSDNDDEGFANAVERYVLPAAAATRRGGSRTGRTA